MYVGYRGRICLAVIVLHAATIHAQGFIQRTKVSVREPTRMDWTFATTGQSVDDAPETMSGYRSTAQRYDFYGPVVANQPMPLVLFISYRSTPMGMDYLGKTCVQNGVIFVEPWNVGNSAQTPERIRIVLDCLDDVRRRYAIDPDRTYLAGYSGGASIAQRIVTALPEYFGGVLTANASFGPPQSPWTLDRARNRVSFAMIVGENESAGFEMSQVQAPLFQALRIRAQCQVIPRAGHAAAPPAAFASAFQWLEQGTAARRRSSSERPVLCMHGNPNREQWATAALDDCQMLLDDANQVHLALGILKSLTIRWPDVPQAEQAQKLLDEFEAKEDQPWVEAAHHERLEYAKFLASIYDRAAVGKSSLAKIPRAYYAQGAIDNYRVLILESKEHQLLEFAKTRIEPLTKLVENVSLKVPSTLHPVPAADPHDAETLDEIPIAMQFTLNGPYLVRDMLVFLESRLGNSDPVFEIAESEIKSAGLTLDRKVILQARNARMHELLYSALAPVGLTFRFDGERILILPQSRD